MDYTLYQYYIAVISSYFFHNQDSALGQKAKHNLVLMQNFKNSVNPLKEYLYSEPDTDLKFWAHIFCVTQTVSLLTLSF